MSSAEPNSGMMSRQDRTYHQSAIFKGNEVELLRNGVEIFPALLAAIESSEKTICFETFVYWRGDIAQEFAQKLAERARYGVEVLVLLDGYGSHQMEEGLTDLMVESGVIVERFRPLSWHHLRRINHRTHRKLLIVDGSLAFTGGVGIADEWSGSAQDPDHWRDNHYRIRGPAVAEVQRVFFLNWARLSHPSPERADPHFYPDLTLAGDAQLEIVAASPDEGPSRIHAQFLNAISQATATVHLATAYFMPGERLIRALLDASSRGVAVEILVCGPHIDSRIVRQASRHHWGRLLQAGIRIFEYQPTLFHVKSLIIDQKRTIIGSANFDSRSCQINAEVNVAVRCESFAREHVNQFSEDCDHAREVVFSDWTRRPISTKVLGFLANLFRRQL